MNTITYRTMKPSELIKIKEIDRSEYIHEIYVFENNVLVLKPDHCIVNSFDTEELEAMIEKQHHILEGQGTVIGAFEMDKLIGVASVENKKRGINADYSKMDILYVSNKYRGKKIGHSLIEACKDVATTFGTNKLYISATPTKATVDFYLREGAILTKEIDSELFKLEPLDIHLELQF
ncbi:GNAT family N-acetyltransferase [Flavobacterium sp. '19STA2R22 D10 B1']|uniref:GNAT family N-acetyltransferase n=1 Tax=Flavobacterium aerium TaxID=3037261 RepID=UPI00278C89FE|nr:GNAT family N-acetyltransferase [Flavobacterium sp. '19STA2R22 D10 B1']